MAHNIVFCSSWQFLFGSAHVLKQPLFRQACELAFAECDAEGDNCCMEKEVCCSFFHFPKFVLGHFHPFNLSSFKLRTLTRLFCFRLLLDQLADFFRHAIPDLNDDEVKEILYKIVCEFYFFWVSFLT